MNELLALFDSYLNLDCPPPWTPDPGAGRALCDLLEEQQHLWAQVAREIIATPIIIPVGRPFVVPERAMVGDTCGVSYPLCHSVLWELVYYLDCAGFRAFRDGPLCGHLLSLWGAGGWYIDLPEDRLTDLVVTQGADACRCVAVAALIGDPDRTDALTERLRAEMDIEDAYAPTTQEPHP